MRDVTRGLRSRSTWAAVCFMLLSFSGLAFAANTGSLAGIVLDSDGAPLPGVTVRIASDALIGGPQVTVSGTDGRFSFHLLPVGDYSVEASLAGYSAGSGEVRIQSVRVGSITFRMVPEEFAGAIEVNAEVPVVDTTQVNMSVAWDEGYLQRAGVGTANRYYHQVLAQAPGVSLGASGNPTVYGGTYGENSYLIDGMNTTDPSFGTRDTIFNIDAVQEMSFQTGGFEAEFGQATGGIVNLVTKSGGNRFSGSLDARYRDEKFTESGDHYDPDENSEWRHQYSGTLGGPILRDRLWFFTSAQFINYTRREADTHFEREWEGWQLLAKSTWQAADGLRVIFKGATEPAEIHGQNHSRYVLESAKLTQEQRGDLWTLELNSVLSESWLLVAQVGTDDWFTRGVPTDNPDTLSGHWNEDTGLYRNNPGWSWDTPRGRDEYRVNATWFVDRLAGSHELKAGLEYNRVWEERVSYRNGGAFVVDHDPEPAAGWDPVDLNGDGYFNHFLFIEEPEDRVKDPRNSFATISTFFLQDAWRPHPRLTVKAGIRFDNVTPENHAGERIADMDRWQPRLGLALDIAGNARHVLRGSVGRFMDPTSLYLPWFAAGIEGSVADHEYNTLEYYCNLLRGAICDPAQAPPSWGDPILWTNWAGQEYTLFDNRGVEWPTFATTVDQEGLGRLRAPYADELIVAYETQVATDSSVELSYVYKKSEDLIEDTCSGNAWAYGAAPYPSLDDPSTWTTGDDCDHWLFVNMPRAERTYDAWILRGESRQGWGHIQASYTYSNARGTNYSGPQTYAYGEGDYFPVKFYNWAGKMPDHRRHRVKLNGYFLLPKRFAIGVDGFWSSEGHQTVASSCESFITATRRSELDQMDALGIDPATVAYCTVPGLPDIYWLAHWPRGSLETKGVWQLDLQLTKAWRIGEADLEAIVTIYNLFDHEWDRSFSFRAFLQDTDEDGEGLFYQDDDPNAPYYDEYYGADRSPVLVPIGAPESYWDPRRYEVGVRIEF